MKRTLVEANIPEWRKKASRTKSGLPGKHRLREKRLLTARAPAHVPRYTLYDVETSFLRASVCIMRPIVKTAKKRRTTHRQGARECVLVVLLLIFAQALFSPSVLALISYLKRRGRGSRRRAKSFVSLRRKRHDVRNSQNRRLAQCRRSGSETDLHLEPVFASGEKELKPLICRQNAN